MTAATWRIIAGDCRQALADVPDRSVHTVVTSPPYFGLRDYGHDGQIGLEPTPDEFVEALVTVFREVRRVLRDDGTAWLNLGDSYNNRAVSRPSSHQGGLGFESDHLATSWRDHAASGRAHMSIRDGDLKEKDLIGVPWLAAFALRADGWFLRAEVIWHKPNPMPESVRDRPTKAHETIFLLSKRARYYYDADAIREDYAPGSEERIAAGFKDRYQDTAPEHRGAYGGPDGEQVNPAGRNKRSVWTVSSQPYSGAHFATFPPRLIEPCILAGAPERACGACGAPWERETERRDQGHDGSRYGERARDAAGGALDGGTARSTLGSSGGQLVGRRETVGFAASCDCDADPVAGVVLDPFTGAGTTAVVALRLGRSFVGTELNPDYVRLARDRIVDDAPLLNSAAEVAA